MDRERYLVTTHPWLEGVALSRPGHWGGFRYPDAEAATQAALAHARGRPVLVTHETAKPRRVR